jgi:hypothetical protein
VAAAPGKTPIVILGGRDAVASAMPEGVEDKHPLLGYKGAAVRFGGRALIAHVVERLRASDCFGPIHIAGPRSVYTGLADGAAVIDVTGSIGETICAGIEGVDRAHGGVPVAFTTCDILPEVDALRRAMARYDAAAPCDGFLPMIRAPEDPAEMGLSAYKPTYRVAPEEGAATVEVLPCHLAVIDPGAFRLGFIFRVLELIYGTRNRSVGYRRRVMLPSIVLELLYQDLLHILGLRLPNLTWSVLRSGLPATRALRAGTITRPHLETAIRTIFITARHRARYPERRIVMPLLEGLSLALDIDTEEEAAALKKKSGSETH